MSEVNMEINKLLKVGWTCKYCGLKNELKIEQINEAICACGTKMNDSKPSKIVSLKQRGLGYK
jgi:hypothetical protein